VDTCASGPEALLRMQAAMASGQPHHLLLTDWKMPGMDGITFARHALSLPPEARPCVLLVTAFARDEALRAADGVGLAGILNKPVTPSTLLDTITRALGQDTPVATPAASTTNRVLQNAQRQLAGARVLLVEDQPMNQELARDLLERAGMRVVTASHGVQCLEKLEAEGPFDGVLMDCQMPVMDGYTATERIRAQPAWQSLPVIAMTASAMASDRERVLACGMNDHITKPLDLAQMFTIMARWIVPRRGDDAGTDSRPAPMPSLDSPQSLLGSLSSLDTVDGLSRCMGNLNLYQRLLKGFARTQHDFATQLAAAPDREAAIRVAHTLKGLAGNIGATRLHQAVSQLEAHMQSSSADDPNDLRSQVQSDLALTLHALQAVLDDIQRLNTPKPAITEHQRIELDDPALQARLHTLRGLVADHDAEAREQFHELMHSTQALQAHPAMLQLQRALERYDFDEAAQTLNGLLPGQTTPGVAA
jgi:two-component system sensor histidine kinase/response regulator